MAATAVVLLAAIFCPGYRANTDASALADRSKLKEANGIITGTQEAEPPEPAEVDDGHEGGGREAGRHGLPFLRRDRGHHLGTGLRHLIATS